MVDAAAGLTAEEVAASRAAHGDNVIAPPPRTSAWKLYLEKFDDPIIRILLIAAGLAILVGSFDGHFAEGVGILVAILLATFLAFWNEHRAAREFDVLNTSSDDQTVKVLRDGSFRLVPRREVVVGDHVFVEVGEEFPADGVLSEAVGLTVNESKLTGEAVAVAKEAKEPVHRGTTVVDGYGVFLSTAVGSRTTIGRTLKESIEETDDPTPLNKQLAKLGKIIGVVGFTVAFLAFTALLVHGLKTGTIQLSKSEAYFLAAVALGLHVALLNIWLPIVFDLFEMIGWKIKPPEWLGSRSWIFNIAVGLVLFLAVLGFGVVTGAIAGSPYDWLELTDARQLLRNFMIAVTIIVVAVPEGLAMSVTLSLAYSMRKMTAQNTLVRRMAACETIGAATVICSDKTGTLTLNEMRVAVADFQVDQILVAEAFAVNSTAHLTREAGLSAKPVGNPTEAALLLWLDAKGIDYLTIRQRFAIQEQWIFNTERKYMATLGDRLHVKGAPEIILQYCTQTLTKDGPSPMSPDERETILKGIAEYQSRGMRVLAFAMREGCESRDLDALVQNLTWLGIAAITDPVRPEVPAAIMACRAAGIQVKIVTGDNAETAREIGRQIGLDDSAPPMTGPEFAALPESQAAVAVRNLQILARARPADKLRLVRLLKGQGQVVAVTGDGVNDGPALNYADVGLAMGKTGTSVAREASDIVLLDDSFPSIVSAVRWGRSLYENIQRFILFQLTINVVALGLAVLGPFLGYELPLTVMQMLWVNLIMDTFAALALATEPPHDDVLKRPPRSPSAFIVSPAMARSIFGTAVVFLTVLLGLIVYWQSRGQLEDTNDPTREGTIIFTLFVLLQFWNLFNAKAMGHHGSVLATIGNNKAFLVIAAAILVGQVLLVQFGGSVFRTVPLAFEDWAVLLGASSLVLVAGEAWRLVRPAIP